MSEIQEFDVNPLIAITFPPGCEGCAVQCTLSNRLGGLMLQKQSLEAMGMNMMGDGEGSFDAMIEQQVPEEEAETAKMLSRQHLGQQIDYIEAAVNATQNEIDQNALVCRGVRKVQFTEDERDYTVNVCTSDRVNNGCDTGFPLHVSTHIQTDTANKPVSS